MLLLVALRRLLRRRLVYVVPASVVVRLPARSGVLVHIAVVSGIHITVGRLACSSIAIGRAGGGSFTALRSLHCSRRTIRVSGVLGICRVAVLADHGLPPRPIGV